MKLYANPLRTIFALILVMSCLHFPLRAIGRRSPTRVTASQYQPRPVAVVSLASSNPCLMKHSFVGSSSTLNADIKTRNYEQKGISVEAPKIYDDALLQQMLRSAEARLASVQLIDQASIAARLGAVTGASQQTSGVAFNVQGSPVPQVVTTTKLPTEATTSNTQTSPTGTTTSLQTVGNLATEDVQTTRAAFNPPAVTAPAPAITLPSAFSVSSSDILNEQMQLAAEINGLRLLLSGSLSDYFINTPRSGSDPELTKLKTTLGFNIALSPDDRYKDAAAIVEVEVRTCNPAAPELPAVTAILPREKTYNVAAISESSTSLGGGVATGILGVSGSWLRGHKTYYLVQDQDTVALTYKPVDPNRTGFSWQFRPVLGRHYVKAGLKQTFVQLAFPTLQNSGAGEIGQVTVRTYWRKYDRKTGILKGIIRDSLQEVYQDFDIRSFREPVLPIAFNEVANFEDLGGGQILVKLDGRFLPGTYVRIGNTLLTDLPRLKQDYQGIKFLASTSELVNKKVFIVAHDGREEQLTSYCSMDLKPLVSDIEALPVDDSTTRLKAAVKVTMHDNAPAPNLYFVVGQRVFGDVDNPLSIATKGGKTYYSALVPNSIFAPNAKLVVRTLLAPQKCTSAGVDISGLKPPPGPERLGIAIVQQSRTESTFLITGPALTALNVLSPGGARWREIQPASVGEKMRLLILPAEALKTNKQLLLQRGIEQPFLISIPEFDPRKPVAPKALGRIGVGSDEVVIVGEGFSDLEGVSFREQAITGFKVVNDQTLRLSGLVSIGLTSTSGSQRIFLKFKSSPRPVDVDIQVVNNIVSTQPD